MTKPCLVAVIVLALAVTCHGCGRSDNCNYNNDGDVNTPCGICGPDATVTIRMENAQNDLDHSVLVTARKRELIFFLEDAAKQDKSFQFTGVYHHQWGYYIQRLNGTDAVVADKTYWQILDVENDTYTPLELGVSSYVVENGQTILFKFTTWGVPDTAHGNDTSEA